MSLLMSAVGFKAVEKMFRGALPGPIEPWHVQTNTEYAAYVELGTKKMRAKPYMIPAMNETMANTSELETKAKSLNDFIRLITLRIEALAKKNCAQKFEHPTGNLMRSIEAEKMR